MAVTRTCDWCDARCGYDEGRVTIEKRAPNGGGTVFDIDLCIRCADRVGLAKAPERPGDVTRGPYR